MKSPNVLLAILFIAGCIMNGCTQDKLPTEPYTHNSPPALTGSGVLMADIDGSLWTAKDVAGIPSGTSTFNGNILHISGFRGAVGGSAESGSIDLVIDLGASKAEINPGTYQLGTIPAQEGEARHRDDLSCSCQTNSTHLGSVTITAVDMSRKVVSGIFDFDGIGADGQTHIVRGGIFDVTWR